MSRPQSYRRSPLYRAVFALCVLLTALLFSTGFASGSTTAAPLPPDPVVQEIIDQVSQMNLMYINAGLSGERPVVVGGEPYTFATRYTRSAPAIEKVWQYAYEQFGAAGFTPSYHDYTSSGLSLKNSIGEKTGTLYPNQIFLLTAHIDSTASGNPYNLAPGADDNGSGSTVLFEAARILAQYPTDYTIRLVAFTGEEQGLWGSAAYAAAARARNDDIRGVLNADMIAWDLDNDSAGEIHAGTRSDSNAIADVFFDTVSTYNLQLSLTRFTTGATTASDHASFWRNNYPAFLAIEETGSDFNDYYHTVNDRQNCGGLSPCGFNATYFTRFSKALIGTFARLAGARPAGGATATPTTVPTFTFTATATATPEPPTATFTPEPSYTATPVWTATSTPVQPTATPTQCAVQFSDVPPGSAFYTYVRYLACAGIVSGYADGTFRPYNDAARGQMTKIVALAEGWTLLNPPTPHFSDVPTTHPFYQYVETAYDHGAISGYADGTFHPYDSITRGQLSKVVVLAEGWALLNPPAPSFRDVLPGSAFYRYVETAYDREIISGYSCGTGCLEFRPANSATRGQISKIVYNAITAP